MLITAVNFSDSNNSRKVPQLVQNASIMRNARGPRSATLWFLCCENVYVPAPCQLWRLDQHCAAGRQVRRRGVARLPENRAYRTDAAGPAGRQIHARAL